MSPQPKKYSSSKDKAMTRYAWKIANKQCVNCVLPALEGKRKCAQHLKLQQESNAKFRKVLKTDRVSLIIAATILKPRIYAELTENDKQLLIIAYKQAIRNLRVKRERVWPKKDRKN